jgi:hypothetical protein
MQRVDSKDNVPALPELTEGVKEPGYFSDGDQANEIPGTVVPAWWLNTVQEEICAVIGDAGIDLQKNVRNQLITAIKKILNDSAVAQKAKDAYEAATTAKTHADTAKEDAAAARTASETMAGNIVQILETAQDARLAANNAERTAYDAMGVFIERDEDIDLDIFYDNAVKIYLSSTNIAHLPDDIPEGPYFLTVIVNQSDSAAVQEILDAATLKKYARSGTVDHADAENVTATWTAWAETGGQPAGGPARGSIRYESGIATGDLLDVAPYVVGSNRLLVFHDNLFIEPGPNDQYQEVGEAGTESTQIRMCFDIDGKGIIQYLVLG